ncbi:hypothetical protein HHL21_14470 [Massilia sp. RP-1-19]|uniref:Uncharacterized protein n=1 Tax=Massilia polaris TaxID=2728846 RepID=A0A848HU98_9BURK|nr:hypothetical protein [Massilia polaris]NML62258.1 hypothetical protein [Massilia polaris]
MAGVQITGLPELLRRMDEVARQQAPFAMAKAMTKTMRQAKVALDAHIPEAFDRPTPFTQRAVAFSGATKRDLTASVFVKDIQAKYLRTEAEGGPRQFKSFEEKFAEGGQTRVALPGRGAPLNQYGNLTKAKIKQIARDVNTSGKAKRFFSGKPKGQDLPAGIYTRTNNNKSITPLLVFATAAVYEKRFKFSEIGTATITAQFEANMVQAWAEAVRTAR